MGSGSNAISDVEPVTSMHGLGQLQDRELVRVPDVHRPDVVGVEQRDEPADLVVDVAERPRLLAVAVHRERLAPHRLHEEVRHHPPVGGPQPRTVGVEDAHDAHVEVVAAVVRERERLGEALRLVVDAARADRVDVAPVVLGLRVHLRVAVHLARGREEEPRALGAARARACCACRANRPSSS